MERGARDRCWWALLVLAACATPVVNAPPPSDTGATGGTAHTGPPHSSAPRPLGGNVLLLLADDLSPAFVGAYGERPEVRTPVIDGLARDGVLFRNAWGYPECSPARTALLTGRHARRTKVGANVQTDKDPPFELSPAEEGLAAMLGRATAATWTTAYLGKWHVPNTATDVLPGARALGFGYFRGTKKNLVTMGPEELAYFDWNEQLDDGSVERRQGYVTTDTVDDALEALRAAPEPWVVQVALHAPHDPWHVPPAALRSVDLSADAPPVELYEAMVEAMDTEIGRLLASVPADVRARTTVIFLGDNGSPDLGLGDERHKLTLYDGGVRVPLVVQGPLVGAPGAESASLVSVVDLFPTLAELAGVPPGDRPLDGASLVDVLRDPATAVHTRLWAERFDPPGPGDYRVDKVTVRDERFKLIRDRIEGKEQLFEYVPGARDEGPDLLRKGPLTSAQQAAYAALSADVDARLSAMLDDLPYPP